MIDEVFKQFEKQFGEDWNCTCGSAFELEWIEVVSRTKNSLLARYSCKICGREQMFAVSFGGDRDLLDAPTIEVPSGAITSDDVLDIRKEIGQMRHSQIRNLKRRKTVIRTLSSKVSRK